MLLTGLVLCEEPFGLLGSATSLKVAKLCHIENGLIKEGAGSGINLGNRMVLTAGNCGTCNSSCRLLANLLTHLRGCCF